MDSNDQNKLVRMDDLHIHRQMEHKHAIADAVKKLPKPPVHSYTKSTLKSKGGSSIVLPEFSFSSANKRVHSSRSVYNNKTKGTTDGHRPKTTPFKITSFNGQPSKIIPATVSLMLSASSTSTYSIHRPKPLQLRYYCNKKVNM